MKINHVEINLRGARTPISLVICQIYNVFALRMNRAKAGCADAKADRGLQDALRILIILPGRR